MIHGGLLAFLPSFLFLEMHCFWVGVDCPSVMTSILRLLFPSRALFHAAVIYELLMPNIIMNIAYSGSFLVVYSLKMSIVK